MAKISKDFKYSNREIHDGALIWLFPSFVSRTITVQNCICKKWWFPLYGHCFSKGKIVPLLLCTSVMLPFSLCNLIILPKKRKKRKKKNLNWLQLQMERSSNVCQKFTMLRWFCFISLCDWLRDRTTLSTNRIQRQIQPFDNSRFPHQVLWNGFSKKDFFYEHFVSSFYGA